MQIEKILSKMDEYLESSIIKPSYESLSQYEVPKWYKDAKFGIFCHFGPYSIPKFGHDWYVRSMYTKDDYVNKHHIDTYGDLKDYGYKYLITQFKAEKFSAIEWVTFFKKINAKYIVGVAEHHDGFQMYHSSISEWNSFDKGPKIDFMKELHHACNEQGIPFNISTHRAEHWFFLD